MLRIDIRGIAGKVGMPCHVTQPWHFRNSTGVSDGGRIGPEFGEGARARDHLPAGEVALAPGAAFVTVMQDLAQWGEVTVVLNTGPVTFEAKGTVPPGRLGHGFYNMHGGPIGGHVRAEACARIAFVA